MEEYEAKHPRRIDPLEWDPKPKTILKKEIIDGKVGFMKLKVVLCHIRLKCKCRVNQFVH